MKRPRLLRLLALFGPLLCGALLSACEPVPANTVISCKLDSDCPMMLRCSGNICRRKALMMPVGGSTGAAGMPPPANNAGAAAVKPTGQTATAVGMMTSGQSMSSSAAAPSGSAGTGATDSTPALAGAGAAAPAFVVMCPSDACMPGGTCMQGATDYSCICNSGFLPSPGGKRCQPIQRCPERACIPGGKCVEGPSDFTCMCDPGYDGTGTKDCKPSTGGTSAAAGGACTADACGPGGQCMPSGSDYTCKCAVELRMPEPKDCPLIDKQDGTVFDVKRILTWQKDIGSTPKGALSPLDDATTAMRYCSSVTQPAATWRAPTAEELRAFPPLASDRHACFGTTGGQVCNDIPIEAGQTTPANSLDMRCVH